jgi:hypothetical protein
VALSLVAATSGTARAQGTPPDTGAAGQPAPEPPSSAPPAEAPPEPAPQAPAPESAPPQAPPQAPAAQPAAPSAEDQAALQAALQADAASNSTTSSSPSATPAQGGSTAVQSLNPDISAIADIAAAYFSQPNNLENGDHDPKLPGFNLQQFELSFQSSVDPYFRFDSHLVFKLDSVELEEAYATTTDLPGGLQVRAGEFLTLFGRINSTHPHTWDFVDQPFAISRIFGGDGNRGLGAELSWLTPLPWYVELVGSMTDATGADNARSFLGMNERQVRDLADFEYVTAIKQFFALSDDWSLSWGLSGAFGPNGQSLGSHTEVYGTDVYLKWRPITYQSYQTVALHSEWMFRHRVELGATLQDVDGFAALLWRFAMRWTVAARYEYGSPAYDSEWHETQDSLDPKWTEGRQRIAAATTFFPSEFSRLRLQGSVDLPDWRPQPIWAVFLAFEVAIGAHGAHPF